MTWKAVNDIDDELAGVDAREAELRATAGNDTLEARKGAHGYCQQVLDEWPSLTVDVKRDILRAFARSMLLGKDLQVRISWRDPSEIAGAYADNKLPALRAVAAPPAFRAAAALPALPPAEPSLLRDMLEQTSTADLVLTAAGHGRRASRSRER